MADQRKSEPLSSARRAAYYLMMGVTEDHLLLIEAMQDPNFLMLSPQDKARAQRLAETALRFAGRADHFVKPHIAKKPPLEAQNIFRLGLSEIMVFDAPVHAVINEMVTIAARSRSTQRLKGLINAVMRKAATDAQERWGKAPVPGMPKWLRKPVAEAFGNPACQSIEAAHMRGAKLDISVKSDPEKWAETLGGTVMPSGSVRLDNPGQITAMPGFEEGDWWVQDAAAAMPVKLSGVQKGDKVLDLCAAPGGKTMQLASLGAEVTAVDISETRLERVNENLARTKLTATVVAQDVFNLEPGDWDHVILDAPCSATGTIRRHPDLPFARNGVGLEELVALQKRMLRHAGKLVKSGGTLVYATCSLIPDEGEKQIERFLAKNSLFTVKQSAQSFLPENALSAEGGYRLRPDYWKDHGGMDGFYIAVLEKS